MLILPHFVRIFPKFNCSRSKQPSTTVLSLVRTIKSTTSKTLDSLGEWDSSRDMPLSLDASIAEGKPIPKLDLSNVGVSSVKGRRKKQEDQISMSVLGPNLLYLGLFDGHGGVACSHYCAQQMSRHISHLIYSRSDLDLVSVLHTAFLEVNNAFARWFTFNRTDAKMQSSGTTATVCLIHENMHITIAHVGDSRAILCRGGEARKLTTDHAPDLLPEKRRIEKSGGEIINNRVNGRLAMTRSIGDLELKKFGVTAEPEIRVLRISHSRDAFLVLTTDGVNAVMTDQEITETVKQAGDPTEAAHLVTDTAMQYSSEDNSTAMVIPLGSWGKYSAAATIFHSFGKSFTSSSRFG